MNYEKIVVIALAVFVTIWVITMGTIIKIVNSSLQVIQ
jgi:hypothetical protein